MKNISKILVLIFLLIINCGCVRHKLPRPAPVTEGWRMSAASKHRYVVQKSDTLYSIAWAFALDYRDLAKINHLEPPYKLNKGQRIYIRAPTYFAKKRAVTNLPKEPPLPSLPVRNLAGWVWPTAGRVVVGFSNKHGSNKGIDIAGSYGQPIVASHSGRVVYCGTGIRSYGNLIIIKHNAAYLSAYTYNQAVFVKEGDSVVTGQKISLMGKDDAGSVRTHFEIRIAGKPVNPLQFLPRKNR